MEKETILNYLSGLKKEAVIVYMDSMWETMTEIQRHSVFGELNEQILLESLTAAAHLETVQIFYTDSIKKKYYAPFDINSKNFMHVPEKTEIWFDSIGHLLDRTCELVKRGDKDIALQSFKLLFDLIKIMENGDEIVFAHEYGDWMIIAKQDYQKVYQELQTK